MTDPHSELIINAILAQLQTINAGDGYFTTPGSVQRYDRDMDMEGARPSITIFKGTEGKTLRGATWDCDLVVEIEGIISSEDDAIDGVLTDTVIARFQDDIEMALKGVDWEGLHAVFNRLDMTSTITDDPNDPEDGLRITLKINYAHDVSSTRAPLAI